MPIKCLNCGFEQPYVQEKAVSGGKCESCGKLTRFSLTTGVIPTAMTMMPIIEERKKKADDEMPLYLGAAAAVLGGVLIFALVGGDDAPASQTSPKGAWVTTPRPTRDRGPSHSIGPSSGGSASSPGTPVTASPSSDKTQPEAGGDRCPECFGNGYRRCPECTSKAQDYECSQCKKTRKVGCKACVGRGMTLKGVPIDPCPVCGALVPDWKCPECRKRPYWKVCAKCNGNLFDLCPKCGGSGKKPE
jgi:hypothetical protein